MRFLKVLYDWTGWVTYMIRNINLGGEGEFGSDFGTIHTEYYWRETYIEVTLKQEGLL